MVNIWIENSQPQTKYDFQLKVLIRSTCIKKTESKNVLGFTLVYFVTTSVVNPLILTLSASYT